MAKKVKRETKQEKIGQKEEQQKNILERLGFVQLMFDFYTTPVA